VNLLKGARVYLSGPIEAVTDAKTWRKQITLPLLSMGIEVWDPLVKPKWIEDIDGLKQREMKQCLLDDSDSDLVSFRNHNIRQFGLHLAANCDFVIMRISCREFTIGTYEELAVARYKPVLCLCDNRVPSMWLVDQLDAYDNLGFTFHVTMGSLVHTIRQIDSGVVVPSDKFRWIFLTYRG
jgi:hypothetical protein